MRPNFTDGVAWYVHRSVCQSVCHNREPCKTAELTDMPFGMWIDSLGLAQGTVLQPIR